MPRRPDDEDRPQDGHLVVWLYGKTADRVRAECKARQMSPDEFVKQILWLWEVEQARIHHRREETRA